MTYGNEVRWRKVFGIVASIMMCFNSKWGHFEASAIFFAAMVWLLFGT